ncbi:MAG TPA: hypothetical protein VMY76_14405 [Gemmatimonadales bacterium]|nr:hypothetical protein [Gemmatimonadales bacterium]
MTNAHRPDPSDPLPESAMGGGSDAGAHGQHPASHPDAPPRADVATGDAAIERRHRHDEGYQGPERRQGRQPAGHS